MGVRGSGLKLAKGLYIFFHKSLRHPLVEF